MSPIPTLSFMEATSQSHEEIKWDALAMTLRKEFETLGLNLEAAALGDPPVCVDLCFIFNQCLELDALRVQLEQKYAAWCLKYGLHSPTYEIICCGKNFKSLKYLLAGQQNSAWDITLASIDWRHLRVHARMCEEDDRLGTREKHAIEIHLGFIALHINRTFLEKADLALILRDHEAMKSYCVLGLFRHHIGSLLAVKALADADGAIYVHGDVESVWGVGSSSGWSLPSIYIRSQHDFSKHTLTRTSFPESAQELQEVGMRDTEGRIRRDNLHNAPPETDASAYTVVPTPRGVVAHNEARSVLRSFQDPSTNTHFQASYPQSGITDHYARMAMGPSGALTASERAINVYGFTHITPSVPMNNVIQGLLPHESGDRAAPVSMTSPEADSLWSERDEPPPPYALSPGTYHLRLEAATRPSPLSG